jgi:hypothetical protein
MALRACGPVVVNLFIESVVVLRAGQAQADKPGEVAATAIPSWEGWRR